VKEDPQIRSVELGKNGGMWVIRILSQFGLALNLGIIKNNNDAKYAKYARLVNTVKFLFGEAVLV
jgi:hypothetical protein